MIDETQSHNPQGAWFMRTYPGLSFWWFHNKYYVRPVLYGIALNIVIFSYMFWKNGIFGI